MRFTSQVMGLLGVLTVLAPGCTTPRQFPENEGIAVHTSTEFGILSAQPDSYKGKMVRMAGRMDRIMKSGKGFIIVAEWLPYPSEQDQGPMETIKGRRQRFTLLFRGPLDLDGMMLGNKFLVFGKIEPKDTTVLPLGPPPRYHPVLIASCIHVWSTGTSEIDEAPDVENTGYPPLRQTYCVDS